MDELTAEFEAWWCEKQDVPFRCANELLLMDYAEDEELLTGDQRDWLLNFIERWDAQQAIVDRLANLRKLGATV